MKIYKLCIFETENKKTSCGIGEKGVGEELLVTQFWENEKEKKNSKRKNYLKMSEV